MDSTKSQKRKAESLYSQKRFEKSLEISNSVLETDLGVSYLRLLCV